MRRAVAAIIASFIALIYAPATLGQLSLDPLARPTPPGNMSSSLTDPSLSPGISQLFSLEAQFARDTAQGGGKAFASWFADDAVLLSNKQAPVQGLIAIEAQARWSAEDYQLTWTPQGGRMSSSGDMGFTWGHYDGHSKDRDGNTVTVSGRYMTVWKKEADGKWKVALDSSNEEPAAAGDCCKLP